MSRKGQTKIRRLEPDTLYQSPIVAKLINRSLKDGKKTAAQNQVYKALEILKKNLNPKTF